MSTTFSFTLTQKSWPTKGEFRLSRGGRNEAKTLQMQLTGNGHIGQSEAVPYARYGESIDSVVAQVESIRPQIMAGIRPEDLLTLIPAGAARNLCDLALWDWLAKSSRRPVWQLVNLPEPKPFRTNYTLSLGTPEAMAEAAKTAHEYPILKLKLGTPDDRQRLAAIKTARPDAKLIVDANEGWTIDEFLEIAPVLATHDVIMCEQPIRADNDGALAERKFPFCICADESIHTAADIPALTNRYQAVNIKLDKTGGLTEAIKAVQAAQDHNLKIMIGCMLSSSLAIAPAVLLAGSADWVDLDGPLLLAEDHTPGLEYVGNLLYPPKPELWG